jgi:hypothetical protein
MLPANCPKAADSKNSTLKRLRGRSFGRGAVARTVTRLSVPDRSQFEGPGISAFLAPMPLRTVQSLSHPAIIANKNFFSHLRLVSTRSLAGCQLLFAENFFHFTHFFLDRPAHFFRSAAISHVRVPRGPAGLFFDCALRLLHAPLDSVLRARLHKRESPFARVQDVPQLRLFTASQLERRRAPQKFTSG